MPSSALMTDAFTAALRAFDWSEHRAHRSCGTCGRFRARRSDQVRDFRTRSSAAHTARAPSTMRGVWRWIRSGST